MLGECLSESPGQGVCASPHCCLRQRVPPSVACLSPAAYLPCQPSMLRLFLLHYGNNFAAQPPNRFYSQSHLLYFPCHRLFLLAAVMGMGDGLLGGCLESVMGWAAEAPLYDFSGNFIHDAGHFTAMVWAGVAQIGCGFQVGTAA